MAHRSPHLVVDISAHGYGHLAQTAPVLRRLGELLPDLRLTIRSGLPEWKLRQRIALPFTHVAAASDIGYVMVDALSIDLVATALAYRNAHGDFAQRIEGEAKMLATLRPDCVLSNVAYLPLAGAAHAGIPAVAMCSLNWADLFQHYFGHEPWAAPIHAEMLAAYRSATFLRATPGMPMADLDSIVSVGPIAGSGRERRVELHAQLGIPPQARLVVVALGGIPTRLAVEYWPPATNTHWLMPEAWRVTRADFHGIESLDWEFTDLLRSVDAVVTKPGYGTFVEAACNGTAVLYQRRADWPEEEHLIAWLTPRARCAEISARALLNGELAAPLDAVLQTLAPPVPGANGIDQAAQHVADLLSQ